MVYFAGITFTVLLQSAVQLVGELNHVVARDNPAAVIQPFPVQSVVRVLHPASHSQLGLIKYCSDPVDRKKRRQLVEPVLVDGDSHLAMFSRSMC